MLSNAPGRRYYYPHPMVCDRHGNTKVYLQWVTAKTGKRYLKALCPDCHSVIALMEQTRSNLGYAPPRPES